MAPPAPVIQASSSSVAVGENLRVSCSVMGEQDVVVEFNWEYPGQQVRHSGGERADYNFLLRFLIIISLRLIKTL